MTIELHDEAGGHVRISGADVFVTYLKEEDRFLLDVEDPGAPDENFGVPVAFSDKEIDEGGDLWPAVRDMLTGKTVSDESEVEDDENPPTLIIEKRALRDLLSGRAEQAREQLLVSLDRELEEAER